MIDNFIVAIVMIILTSWVYGMTIVISDQRSNPKGSFWSHIVAMILSLSSVIGLWFSLAGVEGESMGYYYPVLLTASIPIVCGVYWACMFKTLQMERRAHEIYNL